VSLKDWWRGYTDADIASLNEKLTRGSGTGEIIWLTPGEGTALRTGGYAAWATIKRLASIRDGHDRILVEGKHP
jgi:hypothetical protein